ncbi:MAG: hypothetical protein HGA54_02535 [Actinobacteria bacterium]|nr:hypothetical protein [Actinomycetota bacterium]
MPDTERLIPNNTSDVAQIDEDSGLHLFRGMITPWDKIKSFKETYEFVVRHAAMFAVTWTNANKVIEPDYEKRQSAMSDQWAEEMDFMWSEDDPMGAKGMFLDRFAIPPFIKEGSYLAAIYADKGDEQTLLAGHIWQASNDRFEKEIHWCPFDIVGPEACDVSQGGGSHFCIGLSGQPLNTFNPERKGCGDRYCHVVQETRDKYDEHPNADGYEWEHWGPPVSGMRKEGAEPIKTECEHLTTGTYYSPTGTKWTTGELYRDFTMWPMAYSTTVIGGLRRTGKFDDPATMEIVKVMFDTAGKMQFAEWNTRKSIREWLGVPESVEDGRVLGGYISMIFQARSLEWRFAEFSEERVVIDTDRVTFEMFGQYPELTPAYIAYFDAMAKVLVNTEWIVRLDEENAPEGMARFVIEKGLYGFRRQKPGYTFDDGSEVCDAD